MFTDFFENLKIELKKDLPGIKAQIKMAPSVRSHFKTDKESTKAGVLLLLYPKENDLYIAFIQRTEYNGPHSGQISFPGGKKEKSDKNIIETALRESQEEVGINPEHVEVIGELTPLHIPISNFIVYPVVGIYNSTPKFKIDPTEVERIIEIKINDFKNPENCNSKEFKYGDLSFTAPIYNPNNITIWGATAMILCEFLDILRKNKD